MDCKNRVLITGAAGFIGFHVSKFLLDRDYIIAGIDNINDYYDTNLKIERLKILEGSADFKFYKVDMINKLELTDIFEEFQPHYVINLGAQAGVRYSIDNPYAYVDSNLVGFVNILELCREYTIKHLIYASSSSVYGGNSKVPFSTNHQVDHPVSLYAATKKANELMAHTYSHLYNIPTTGLRFFTVYGPWGRPDMAYFLFTKAILNNETINVFNHGKMERDFTYIDDIVEAISKLILLPPKSNPNWNDADSELSSSSAPYKIYNIGNNSPIQLEKFISVLEDKIGKKAKKNYMDMQQGDVLRTYADISDLEATISYKPNTPIEFGLEKFVEWYLDFYNVKR